MRQRHPIGLYVLFFTEMWERFGFYCMEAVFVYYMKASKYEFLNQNYSIIYGVYLAGVYFSPFVGGLLSEYRLGYFVSIIVGGLFMAGGYAFLSLEPAVCFVVGLGLIVVGNGLFKPNISTMVGKLYPPGDGRIDAAFTIFYMGINVGALFAPLVAGMTEILVKRHTDWDVRYAYLIVFGIAAAGMIIGELIFLATRHKVQLHLETPEPVAPRLSPGDPIPDNSHQNLRNIALLVFFGINIVFWMAFKQRANSMAIWVKDKTDLVSPAWLADTLQFIGIEQLMLDDQRRIAPPLFLTLNPLFVIILSPLLVLLWSSLRKINVNVSTPAKLVLGFVLLACAYFLMWKVAEALPEGQMASSLVIVQFYLLLTTSELCLSPMGLSLVSKLASSKTRAIWMGGFMVSISVGGFLAGYIYQHFKDLPFADFFRTVTYASLGALVLMMLAYPLIAAALRPPSDASAKCR